MTTFRFGCAICLPRQSFAFAMGRNTLVRCELDWILRQSFIRTVQKLSIYYIQDRVDFFFVMKLVDPS
jgi:hypothetical protein